MKLAFILLSVLFLALALNLIVDDVTLLGAICAWLSLTIVVIAAVISSAEVAHLQKLWRPIAFFFGLPLLWMVAQLLPLGIVGHPIWASAQAALNASLLGSISGDLGATAVAAGRYLAVAAIVFAASAVTVDRRRAAALLYLLVGIATIWALGIIVHNANNSGSSSRFVQLDAEAGARSVCVLGLLLSATLVLRAVERLELRTPAERFGLPPSADIAVGATTFLICCVVTGFFAPIQTTCAGLLGIVTLGFVMALRRLTLGLWGAVLFCGAALTGLVGILTSPFGLKNTVLSLRFAELDGQSTMVMARRILSDTGWLGNGAGTFKALAAVYSNVGTADAIVSPPTAAAQIMIELGPVAFWVLLCMSIGLVAILLHGALQRGRDYFYPALGAALIVTLVVGAFCNAGLFATPLMILSSAALGLAIAQRATRTA